MSTLRMGLEDHSKRGDRMMLFSRTLGGLASPDLTAIPPPPQEGNGPTKVRRLGYTLTYRSTDAAQADAMHGKRPRFCECQRLVIGTAHRKSRVFSATSTTLRVPSAPEQYNPPVIGVGGRLPVAVVSVQRLAYPAVGAIRRPGQPALPEVREPARDRPLHACCPGRGTADTRTPVPGSV